MEFPKGNTEALEESKKAEFIIKVSICRELTIISEIKGRKWEISLPCQ